MIQLKYKIISLNHTFIMINSKHILTNILNLKSYLDHKYTKSYFVIISKYILTNILNLKSYHVHKYTNSYFETSVDIKCKTNCEKSHI